MDRQDAKKTLLHSRHTALGAKMANFGGYEMPVWYPSGAKKEHLAVLTNAGVFDTSHMAVVEVRGPGAFDLLQQCFSRDLESRPQGRCVYGVFMDERAFVIDDAIICKIAPEIFLIVVNAGMGAGIAKHLKNHTSEEIADVSDLTGKVCKLDVQGPMSAKILMKILSHPESVFEGMPYFSFKGHFDEKANEADEVRLEDGTPVLLSRTGYTGEFGFEIFIAPDKFVDLWDKLLDAGREFGAVPCGLAARDSLRTGAVFPLSHQDIGQWPFINNPWTFALPCNAGGSGFTKKFIGGEALLNLKNSEFTYPFAGFDLRKITVDAHALDSDGNEIGRVLTCVTDMGIGRVNGKICSIASPGKPEGFKPKGLSCGFVKVSKKCSPGETIEIRDARRKLKVMIVDDIRPDRTARIPLAFAK